MEDKIPWDFRGKVSHKHLGKVETKTEGAFLSWECQLLGKEKIVGLEVDMLGSRLCEKIQNDNVRYLWHEENR